MTEQKKRNLFVVFSFLGILFGVTLGTFYLLWNNTGIRHLIEERIISIEDNIFWNAYYALCVLLTFWNLLAYLFSLNRSGKSRPKVIIYVLFVATLYSWFVILLGAPTWQEVFENYYMLSLVIGGIFLIPLIIFPMESLVQKVSTSLGTAFLKNKNNRLAGFFLNLALSFPPYTEILEKAYALSLCENNKIDSAYPLLKKYWDSRQIETRMLGYLSFYLKDKNDVKPAIDCYEELYRRREKNRTIGQDLVTLYLKNNQILDAVRILTEIGDFQDTAFLTYLIKLHIDIGNYAAAVDHCFQLKKREGQPFPMTLGKIEEIIQKAPEDKIALKSLANLCLECELVEKAIESLEKLYSLHSDEQEGIDLLKKLYRQTFQYRKLEKFLHEESEHKPQDASLQFELIEALVQNQHLNDAQIHLEKLVGVFPEDHRFWASLANILYQKKEYISARDALMNALEHCPLEKQNPLMFLKNKILSALLNTELKKYQRAVEENPKDPMVRFYLVEQLMENNYPERAASELDELIYLKPDSKPQVVEFVQNLITRHDHSFLLMNYLADLYLRDKRYDDAFNLYLRIKDKSYHPKTVLKEGCERILQLFPDFPPAIKTLGEMAAKSFDHEMTVQYLARYLELVPDPPHEEKKEIIKTLFYAYAELGNLIEAENTGIQLIELDPQVIQHHKTLSEVIFHQGRLEDAYKQLQKASDLAGDDREIGSKIKELDTSIKKERITELKQLLDKEPDNIPAQIEIGDLLFNFEDYNEALFHYQRAEKLPTGQNIGKVKIALTLAKKGLDSIADEQLDGVLLEDNPLPSNELENIKSVYYEIAKHYEQQKDFNRALDLYKKLFRVDAAYKDVVQRLEKIEPRVAKAKRYSF